MHSIITNFTLVKPLVFSQTEALTSSIYSKNTVEFKTVSSKSISSSMMYSCIISIFLNLWKIIHILRVKQNAVFILVNRLYIIVRIHFYLQISIGASPSSFNYPAVVHLYQTWAHQHWLLHSFLYLISSFFLLTTNTPKVFFVVLVILSPIIFVLPLTPYFYYPSQRQSFSSSNHQDHL